MNRQRYLQVIEPAIRLVELKDEDYNSETPMEEYFPFGDQSYAHELNKKVLRIMNLLRKTPADSATHLAQFESLYDSVLDLVNYGVFYLEYLDSEDGRHAV